MLVNEISTIIIIINAEGFYTEPSLLPRHGLLPLGMGSDLDLFGLNEVVANSKALARNGPERAITFGLAILIGHAHDLVLLLIFDLWRALLIDYDLLHRIWELRL